ncbi:MAG: tetratricopeptide repeat protein [Pseudomonadota bacterium]
MSLINKMLQDLDARGSHGAGFTDMDVKSVVVAEPRVSPLVLAGIVIGAVVVGAAGLFGWRYLKQPATVPAPVVVLAPTPAPALPVAVPTASAAVPAPAPASSSPQQSAPLALTPVMAGPAAQQVDEVRRPRREAAPRPARVRVVQASSAAPFAAPLVSGRQPSLSRSAQSAYTMALERLQQGRVDEAMASLEQALQIDPRHEAARQTLVGLLIEDNKPDQAMAQLQAGLALDPRQPSLAMLLARMQIERGGNGIDTLTRSLPAAGGNAEYYALLAGALQREQRHAEAASQYLAALRIAPQNGVWLMGLGISLQGAKRDAEAVEAFERAKASGTLSPQLLAFVERQLQTLAK